MSITSNNFLSEKPKELSKKPVTTKFIGNSLVTEEAVEKVVQELVDMPEEEFQKELSKFDDPFYWLSEDIADALDELRREINNIYFNTIFQIRREYDIIRFSLHRKEVYIENADYLKKILPGQTITIDDVEYLRICDSDRDEIMFVSIHDGAMFHHSRIAPSDYLLRDYSMFIRHKEEEKAKNHYNNKLDYFDRSKLLNAAMSSQTFDSIIQTMPVSKLEDSNVLDFGCGTGETMLYIIQNYQVRKVYGVDYSEERIKKAVELMETNGIPKEKYEFIIDDVNNFVEKNTHRSFFDVILCFEIIEHLKDPDHVMEHLKELLVLDGSIIGSIPLQQEANDIHLTAFKTTTEVEAVLNVHVYKDVFQMRFPNQHVFHYLK